MTRTLKKIKILEGKDMTQETKKEIQEGMILKEKITKVDQGQRIEIQQEEGHRLMKKNKKYQIIEEDLMIGKEIQENLIETILKKNSKEREVEAVVHQVPLHRVAVEVQVEAVIE
jgi:hypothetical protein